MCFRLQVLCCYATFNKTIAQPVESHPRISTCPLPAAQWSTVLPWWSTVCGSQPFSINPCLQFAIWRLGEAMIETKLIGTMSIWYFFFFNYTTVDGRKQNAHLYMFKLFECMMMPMRIYGFMMFHVSYIPGAHQISPRQGKPIDYLTRLFMSKTTTKLFESMKQLLTLQIYNDFSWQNSHSS